MPNYALADLTEKTSLVKTDLMHVRTVGNIDQKITTDNLFIASREVLSKSSDYVITDADFRPIILMTTGAVDKTTTLPTLADNIGSIIKLIKIDNGVGKAILDGEGAETINGSATWEITEQWGSVEVIAIAAGWVVLSQLGNALNTLKGFIKIALTNYTGVGKPAIVAGGIVEINGIIYKNTIEVAISGATINTTWYDILLTPSGSTFTASFIARGTGVWSDSKQGLYSGNNRVIACAYRNTSDADWINKNTLIVINRTCKIKMEIGDWNMDIDLYTTVAHGFTLSTIRSISVLIRGDTGVNIFRSFNCFDVQSAEILSQYIEIDATDVTLIRDTDGALDGNAFDSTSFNRGFITLEYEV